MKLDQHFTSREEADTLVQSLLSRLDPACARRYIEPACGDGAFVESLKRAGVPRWHIRSVEIDKKLPADIHQDFLKSTRESLGITRWKPDTTIVVGNPPFGRSGKLVRDFLNKAATYANWVCFIVPRSMYMAKGCHSLDPRLELIYERSVTPGFTTTKAKCQWQEWFRLPEGSKGYRPGDRGADSQGLYSIVSIKDKRDLVIQRCGGSAGRVTECNGTGEGKYYIRSCYPKVLHAFRNLPSDERANLTTHQSSLSVRLLHELLERSLLQQYISEIKERK